MVPSPPGPEPKKSQFWKIKDKYLIAILPLLNRSVLALLISLVLVFGTISLAFADDDDEDRNAKFKKNKVHTGDGPPPGGLGKIGDLYIDSSDTDNLVIYKKTAKKTWTNIGIFSAEGGPAGRDGLNCWDLDGDGAKDLPDEDANGDDIVDVLDCKGPKGDTGPPGQDADVSSLQAQIDELKHRVFVLEHPNGTPCDDNNPDTIADTYHDGVCQGKIDSDHDGLADEDELRLGTSSTDPDSDDDGLLDGFEVSKGMNPLSSDSDGDGLSDGEEIRTYSTDPINRDTDGDFLTDGEEINTYRTDPRNQDTDGDRVTDGDEIRRGTDPLNPLSR